MRKPLIAVAIAAALASGPAAAAVAAVIAPTPGSGPTVGGTTVAVPEPRGVTFSEIDSGLYHTLALGDDGRAYAWGASEYGKLGSAAAPAGTATHPVQVSQPAGAPEGFTFTSVSAGPYASTAIGSDGNAYSWGNNIQGQLGDGTLTQRAVPVKVLRPVGVGADFAYVQISAGDRHTLALGNDGNAYAWGYNVVGQLGSAAVTQESSHTPVRVDLPAGVPTGFHYSSVSAGYRHSLALGNDGKAYTWGGGSSAVTAVSAPVGAPSGFKFVRIQAGDNHNVGIASDGNAYGWGANYEGQVGNGSAGSQVRRPVLIQPPAGAPAGFTYVSVEGGTSHGSGIGNDGLAYSWGDNSEYQLGNGNGTSNPEPAKVLTPPNVRFTEVTVGQVTTFAKAADGSFYSWGSNVSAQLGDGTAATRLTPIKVRNLAAVVTGVTFDGVAGTGVADNGDGSWSVVTPPHAPGPVDVVVDWTLAGTAQQPIAYKNGFTYEAATAPESPTVTQASCEKPSPSISAPSTPGLNYSMAGQLLPGGTMTVTATLVAPYSWSAELPPGWEKAHDGQSASLRVIFNSLECGSLTPTAPIVVQRGCAAPGVASPPGLMVSSVSPGITYRINGDMNESNSVTVTATLAPGYSWNDQLPEGWVLEPVTNEASLVVALDDAPDCSVAGTPVNPRVIQPACTANPGEQSPAAVELPANAAGVAYRLEGDVTPGETVNVIAQLDSGYTWPALMPGDWVVIDAHTAELEVKLDNPDCLVRAPVTEPVAVQATCTGPGVTSDPRVVVPANTDGVSYELASAVVAGEQAKVTATLNTGYVLPDTLGANWHRISDTLAEWTTVLDVVDCIETAALTRPQVTQPECPVAPGEPSQPVLIVPEDAHGVVYDVTGLVAPGKRAAVVGSLQFGHRWPTALEPGWVLENDSAVYAVEFEDPHCSGEVGGPDASGGTGGGTDGSAGDGSDPASTGSDKPGPQPSQGSSGNISDARSGDLSNTGSGNGVALIAGASLVVAAAIALALRRRARHA